MLNCFSFKYWRSPLVFVFLLCTVKGISQDYDNPNKSDEPKQRDEIIVIPKFQSSIRGAFKLPNALANNSFKKVFNGVSNIEVTYVYPFAKNFFAAGGIQHYYFDINRFSFPEVSTGNMQSYLVFGEAGFQKYINDKWYYLFSVRAGYGLTVVRSDNCKALGESPPQQMVFFNEELFGIYLRGNERMSYGFLASHQIHHFHFGPQWLCRTNFSGLTAQDYVGPSHSWVIGFGFTYILGEIE